ncbi:MAG: hypothetical protein IJS65_08035 [Clostridia bacterium]|nr:hypothetical protein [Clostridia bacterium]
MKQLKCDMCGSTDFVKDEGFFVCQGCGCKYTVDEARKMMTDNGDDATAEGAKTERSDKRENLTRLLKEAIADNRYDNAGSYCSELMLISPDNPEVIALQGFVALGKEEIITDVPSACVNAIKRMMTVLPDYNASFEEKRDMVNGLKDTLKGVAVFKKDFYNEQIKNLEAQKQGWNPNRESSLQSTYAKMILLGNVFQQNEAKADLEREKAKGVHDRGLEMQISKIREKKQKIDNYMTTFEKEVDTFLEEEERRCKAAAKAAYWEAHKEEKAELENKRAVLTEQIKPISEEIIKKRTELEVIENELRTAQLPSVAKARELRNKILELSDKRKSLGLFKGKEKKEITAEIDELNRQMPSTEEINKEKQELRDKKQPFINEINELLNSLEKQASPLGAQLKDINDELNKDR